MNLLALCGALPIAPAVAQKVPVVTVRQMQDIAGTGQAQAFSQMIQSAVARTGKFQVIESDFADLRDQQELGNSGMVTTNRPGKRGGFESADFLIYGSITSGATLRQTDPGADMGRGVASRMLGAALAAGDAPRQAPAWPWTSRSSMAPRAKSGSPRT